MYTYDTRLTAETFFQSWLSDLTPQEQVAYFQRIEQDRERDRALEGSWPDVGWLKVEGIKNVESR